MFEHTSNGAGRPFKITAMLVLAVAVGMLSIAARKSLTARKMHAWLSNPHNTRNAAIWLSVALMFILFGGFAIADALRN